MNDLHDRFRSLDDLHAPDLWHEAEARAQALPQRESRALPWVLVVTLLLLAVIIGGAALIGSGVVKVPSVPFLAGTPSPSASPTATPITGPIVGTWATGETTCARQLAAVEAAGFSARQMTRVGVDLTCKNGIAVQGAGWGNGSRNTARFLPDGRLVVSDNVFQDARFTYRLIGAAAFEASDPQGICLTYGYAITGGQLSIEIIDYGCRSSGPAPLLDRIGLTVLFETSPFTRRP